MDLREIAIQGSSAASAAPTVQVIQAPYADGCGVNPSYGPTPSGTVLLPGQLNSLCVMEFNIAALDNPLGQGVVVGLGATTLPNITDLVARGVLPLGMNYVAPTGDNLYINEWTAQGQVWLNGCINLNFSGTGDKDAAMNTQIWVASRNASRPLDACKPQRLPIACSPCQNGYQVSYSFPFYVGDNNGIVFSLPQNVAAVVSLNISAYSGATQFTQC